MNIINHKKGPERIIQDAIIKYLENRGWFVVELHGNLYQKGMPDLFATHVKYGIRLIEIKNPEQYCFTPAQLISFPKFTSNGCGIWILTAATDAEYEKLFKKSNWYFYLQMNCMGMR